MQKINAPQLLKKFQDGNCSEEEMALLETWYNQYIAVSPGKLTDDEWAEDVFSVLKSLDLKNKPLNKVVLWPRIVAAVAAILLIISVGAYYFYIDHSKTSRFVLSNKQNDILPGENKAILTLSNGSKIILQHNKNGVIVKEGGIAVDQKADGQLVYNTTDKANDAPATYNTLTTPRGGQYQLELPDGTKVWLNAASSLKYPTAFTGSERKVELSGEAYFEVAKNKNMPFYVKSGNQTIEVLGTHFNINAYADEPVCRTTLLEGKVKVLTGKNQVLLNPGEQSEITISSDVVLNRNADLEKAVAWKNGEFIFSGEDLGSIMRIISHWYNVDITYTRQPDAEEYGGMVSRNKNLSAVLKMLESTGKVSFKVEGRRVTAMPR